VTTQVILSRASSQESTSGSGRRHAPCWPEGGAASAGRGCGGASTAEACARIGGQRQLPGGPRASGQQWLAAALTGRSCSREQRAGRELARPGERVTPGGQQRRREAAGAGEVGSAAVTGDGSSSGTLSRTVWSGTAWIRKRESSPLVAKNATTGAEESTSAAAGRLGMAISPAAHRETQRLGSARWAHRQPGLPLAARRPRRPFGSRTHVHTAFRPLPVVPPIGAGATLIPGIAPRGSGGSCAAGHRTSVAAPASPARSPDRDPLDGPQEQQARGQPVRPRRSGPPWRCTSPVKRKTNSVSPARPLYPAAHVMLDPKCSVAAEQQTMSSQASVNCG